jgi:hypothetical protein
MHFENKGTHPTLFKKAEKGLVQCIMRIFQEAKRTFLKKELLMIFTGFRRMA